MCRIVGILDFKKTIVNELEEILIPMRDSMSEGGPDDAGLFIHKEKGIALGHRRLSIIDVSALGHQPMANERKTIWITYNGEIYNFQDLRAELISKGYKFKSKTDTEVIIYGYEQWGIKGLLSRLRGMFAFGIYDLQDDVLFLARDRFGIKPLYYYTDNEKFIFTSEVKAFLSCRLIPHETNEKALIGFLQLGSVPTPHTTLKNVFSIPAGNYMVVKRGRHELKEYWDLNDLFNKKSDTSSRENIIKQVHDLLFETVKLHLISDVPLGVFLSGGIDSSALVVIASKLMSKPLTTLSIVFNEEKYSEAKYSRAIAEKFKTDHHEILLTRKDFFDELPTIFQAMDQPTIDGVNTYFISKAAKQVGLKVVLSGIGGDEVFLGYKHFQSARYLENPLKLFGFLPPFIRNGLLEMVAKNKKGLKKISYLKEPSFENAYLMFRGLFTINEIENLLGISKVEIDNSNLFSLNGEQSGSLVSVFNFLDFKHYLQNQILKDTDFMSMKHAIEIRVPYLDHVLAEAVIGIPEKIKLVNTMNKSVLIEALKDDLPKEIYARTKMGFTFPFSDWLKNNHQGLMAQCLEHGFFSDRFVREHWDSFKTGSIHWSKVWALVVLSKWIKSGVFSRTI